MLFTLDNGLQVSITMDKKMVFLVTMVGLFALVTTGYISYEHATEVIRTSVEEQVKNESIAHGASLRVLLESEIVENSMLGNDPDLQRQVAELASVSGNHTIWKEQNAHRQEILRIIDKFEKRSGGSVSSSDISIVDGAGNLVFTLYPEHDAATRPDRAYHDMILEGGTNHPGYRGSFVAFEQGVESPSLAIVSSMISDGMGERVGAIISRISTPDTNSIILASSGMGEHGSVYIINNNERAADSSRFADGGAPGLPPGAGGAEAAARCAEKGSEYLGPYRNHLGREVYGAIYCARDLGVTLLAEIDKSAMEEPLKDLQNSLLQAGAIMMACMGAVAVVISKTVSRPIHRLKKLAGEIASGNFDVRSEIRGNDEIGDLAAEFDIMAKKLKDAMIRIKEKEKVIKQQEGMLLQFSNHSERYCVGMIDIVNSTKICSGMNDAQISEFYKIFINSMGQIIHRYDGTVIKNIGDALLFCFSIYGHDEKRILKKCLDCCISMSEIHGDISGRLEKAGLPLTNYRISSTYGTVRIAKSSTSMVEDIFGTTVNRCAKINRSAPPNGVVIGEHFYDMVKDFGGYVFEKIRDDPAVEEHGYGGYVVTRSGRRTAQDIGGWP